ncbi:ATP-dependent RecD-like DNA helicase [Oscillibacter valericigenes]|uniref:SF1B family DNA helicase RecD2 n=1 Tax=Oscillibacter valericigenes TaxID=351091 RepID=UPI001F3C31A7|nr:ATP-dependent RecD-like DNA helicase [Oscillibacter valericigenes]MCF2617289.1 ATP-dependent RecD-like DNA helicase [Oscillibacter valericigenes]
MLCRFDRAIFQSDNGYCVFSYSTQDESVPKEARKNTFFSDDKIHFTAVGYHLVSTNVVEVELDGTWEQSKHGLQMSVTTCKQIVPTDQAGVLAYLSSGIIKGVGPEIAKAIVAKFGDKTMEVLDQNPQQLLSIRGIARTKLKTIVASYEETKALSDLMIYLAPFGVSMKKAAMIKEEFGDQSLQIVKTDPFQLCRIKGFGFMTVDSIARKTKVSLKHPMRYAGAINYVLDEARVSGHLFLSVDETVGRCYDLLNSDCEAEVVSEGEIRQAISNERLESRIYVEGTRVYLSYERMCEVKAAKRIVSMILQEDFEEIYDLDEKIDQAEQTLKQKLAPSQRKAVKLCLSHPISIMTGGPGSGKTTTLRFILDIYKKEYPSNEILLAAPTGRASRRMAEQTGMFASTLHSALGLITDEESPLNDTELLPADLIVVDEFSMVDMRLAYILLERIKPGAQLLIVGDADQLPSVGAGNVLREMIRSEKVPTAVLDTIFRQASNSRIIVNAHAINHNDTHLQYGDDFQMLEVQNAEDAAQLVVKNYLQEVSQHGLENVQILSPFRKRGSVASNALNETIRDLVNPASMRKMELKCGSRVFRVGDRIMQTANRNGVSNGDVGLITGMEKEDDEVFVDIRLLDGRELRYSKDMMEDVEFSYCLTIHKSQGQEYPVIIVPLLKEHYIMLRRNLLYTAVTRAKAKVILIGQRQAVYIAIHKCDVGQRNTVLADRIVAYYNREMSKRVA